MYALPDQSQGPEDSEPKVASLRLAEPDRLPIGRFQTVVVILVSVAVAGAVFGFALDRFGWAGLLIATWPALALAGGFGCFFHDLLLRRPGRRTSSH